MPAIEGSWENCYKTVTKLYGLFTKGWANCGIIALSLHT